MDTVLHGSVVRGTLRFADLIPVLADELRRVSPSNFEAIARTRPPGLLSEIVDRARSMTSDTELAEWTTFLLQSTGAMTLTGHAFLREVVEDLLTGLNDASPLGVYFGGEARDPMNLGWWELVAA